MQRATLDIILTGATGMVGEGILLECLQNKQITSVLSIVRKSTGRTHEKLKELVVSDFTQIQLYADALKGYDACFYAAGKSSLGMTEPDYTHLTFTVTMAIAKAIKEANPQATFCFVSGAQTDATEQGKVMWARVKGQTENALSKLFDKSCYHFRPALMKPMKGQKQFYGYNYFTHKLMYPILSLVYPGCTIQEIAHAMLYCSELGYDSSILEVKDIRKAARLWKEKN